MPRNVKPVARHYIEWIVTEDYTDETLVKHGHLVLQNIRNILTRMRTQIDLESWNNAANQLEFLYYELSRLEQLIEKGLENVDKKS